MDSPDRVADVLRETNRLYTVEHLQVVCLNTRRRLIAIENVAQGTLDQVIMHPREVFSVAIARRASAIILAHNHPSGDCTASESDIKVTREIMRAAQLLKIELVDHVIIGQESHASLKALGYLS